MLLVSLLTTVALVSMQYGYVSGAHFHTHEENFDNKLSRNVLPTRNRQLRKLKKGLTIHSPPPETARHEPGVDLEISCGIIGSPTPQIKWLRNGEIIDDITQGINVAPIITKSIASVKSTLIIREASPNPQDVYTCVGTSGHKKMQATTTVFTDNEQAEDYIQDLITLPAKPRITYFYEFIMAPEFSTAVELPCRITSEQEVELYWTDNYEGMLHEGHKAKVLPSGNLLIQEPQYDDMGGWTCVVKNHLGEDKQTTFLYLVEFP